MRKYSQRNVLVAFGVAAVLLLALDVVSFVAGRRAPGGFAASILRLADVTANVGLLLVTCWLFAQAVRHRRMERQRETFFKVSLDMLAFAGFDGYFKRLNPAWERTLGFTADELMARPHIEFVHPDDREATRAQAAAVLAGGSAMAFENRYLCKDGSYKWLLWNSVPSVEQQTVFAVARDLTDRKAMEERLRELTLTDDLTKLRNRRGFLLIAEQELKLVRDRRRDDVEAHMWIIFADVDGLKAINDELGHDVGSQAIVKAASLLTSTFRDADVIGRLGGDEFGIVAITNEPGAGPALVARVNDALRHLNIEERLPYQLSLSLGVVKVDPERVGSIEDVLREADQQMYRHKRGLRSATPISTNSSRAG